MKYIVTVWIIGTLFTQGMLAASKLFKSDNPHLAGIVYCLVWPTALGIVIQSDINRIIEHTNVSTNSF